jgi:hypothetical protein
MCDLRLTTSPPGHCLSGTSVRACRVRAPQVFVVAEFAQGPLNATFAEFVIRAAEKIAMDAVHPIPLIDIKSFPHGVADALEAQYDAFGLFQRLRGDPDPLPVH